MFEKGELISRGKAKSLYRSAKSSDMLIMEFRDDTSAFDGEKIEQLPNKGAVNNEINAFIMRYLSSAGIATHFIERLDEIHSIVKPLKMLPIEAVVRNRAAGSLVRRLGVELGMPLNPPVFDLFLKNDALHDPMINASTAISFGWATESQLETIYKISLEVNTLLCALFSSAGMILVDFKLEFGLDENNHIVLGDEFSPDGARIWDAQTQESLDKDRFRKGLGSVVESYQRIVQNLRAIKQ